MAPSKGSGIVPTYILLETLELLGLHVKMPHSKHQFEWQQCVMLSSVFCFGGRNKAIVQKFQ
jgi:hypothetical protein